MNQYEFSSSYEKEIKERWFKDHRPHFSVYEDGSLIKIKWRKPDSWNMAVVYYIDCKMGYLLVAGDLGEGVYQWNPPISIDFLGGCSLDYFDGKCQASSCGERGRIWNEEVAISYLNSYIKERTLGEDKGDSFYENLYFDDYAKEFVSKIAPELLVYREEETYKSWKDLNRQEKDKFIVVAEAYIQDLKQNNKFKKLTERDYRRELIELQQKFEDLGPEAKKACGYEHEWHTWLRENGYDFFGDEYYEYGDIGRVISVRVQSHLIGLQMISAGLKSGKFSMEVTKCPWKKFKKWVSHRRFWRKS